ncbi:MAG: hypothetical protein IPJ65_12730 [Archangiaceae bacterium]|nr:hypothetical protein [Archangiaceae bacterium]
MRKVTPAAAHGDGSALQIFAEAVMIDRGRVTVPRRAENFEDLVSLDRVELDEVKRGSPRAERSRVKLVTDDTEREAG